MRTRFTFLALFATFFGQAQESFKVTGQTENEINIEFTQAKERWKTISINGTEYISFANDYKHLSLIAGAPELPVFGETFLLPDRGDVTYQVEIVAYHELNGISIAPSKGNLKRNVDPAQVPYVFGEVYQQNAFYPAQVMSKTEPFVLRSLRGQVVHLCPFQYNPVSKTLRVIDRVKITLKNDSSKAGVNEVPNAATRQTDLMDFGRLFGNAPKAAKDKYNSVTDDGDILIIMPDNYADAMKALTDWKLQEGKRVFTARLSETGSTTSAIKNYVSGVYAANPTLKYLLLVGDHEQLPVYSYGSSGGWSPQNLYSDTWYGQLSGSDYYPELFVGRFSGTVSDIGVMVERNLEYEKTPMAGNWMTKAIGLASGEGAGQGNEGQADWQHMRGLRDQLMASGYQQIYEFYDGTRGGEDAAGNPQSGAIRDAVSAGVGLFNYCGHGDVDIFISGSFTNTQINEATNVGMYPMVISVACNNGVLNGGTCLAEAWQRATENGKPAGSIATCASSILMAWAPPMQTQDEMTNLITAPETAGKMNTIGSLFYNGQLSMLEEYPDQGVEVMQTWIMFADPSVTFRNKEAATLGVSTPLCYGAVLPEQVTIACDQDQTFVAITQGNKLISSGTSAGGSVSLSLAGASTTESLLVTATKPNYYAYQVSVATGQTECINAVPQGGGLVIYPNPVSETGELKIEYTPTDLNAEIRIYNELGQQVVDYVDASELLSKQVIQLHSIRKGMYVIVIEDGGNTIRQKFAVY